MRTRCRFCLSSTAKEFYSVHEEYNTGLTFAEFVHQLTDVDIEYDDGLPQEICGECYYEVRRLLEFGLVIRRADEELRKEFNINKSYKDNDSDQKENLEVVESDFFAEVDTEICVVEEVLEVDADNQDSIVVEEIHDEGEEIHLVEELLKIDTDNIDDEQSEKSHPEKEDLLVELAHVAATQENVKFIETLDTNSETLYIDQENDDNYLIEFNPNETLNDNIKPIKWKCGECKLILRGDVSYEGHMNVHKQLKPHKCTQCSCTFRCRTALKNHKSKHTPQANQLNKPEQTIETSYLCVQCTKSFNTGTRFYIHEVMVHNKYNTSPICPFCSKKTNENLKEHIQSYHISDYNATEDSLTNNDYFDASCSATSTVWQCYVCSKTYTSLELLNEHHKLCHKSDEQEPEVLKIEYLDDVTSTTNTQEELLNDVTLTTTAKRTVESSVQCEICKRKLLRKNISKHMELHNRKDKEAQDESRKYLCTSCPREFKNAKSLHQHEKIHEGECADLVYVCGDCGRQYASEFLLETHRKQAHKERDNICPICGNAFKLKNQLVNHMKLHLEKNIQCPHCEKKYARQFDLNVHLRSHTGEQPFACHLCDKRFAIKVRLTYHLQKHYGVKHQCKECGSEFNSKQKLKAHSFKHTGMPYRCELCEDHGFANRNVFKRHLNRVHHSTMSEDALNEMFQQNTGKTVKIKQVSEQSLVQTTDDETENVQDDIKHEKPVVLNETFTNDQELCEHINSIHLSPVSFEHLYECTECYKSFSEFKLLKKHERIIHSTQSKCVCNLCGNKFRNHSQLSAHKRLHKERPFKCDQCDKAYPRKVELQIHMRTHTGELPYACHLCDKRFAIKVRLTYHLQKHEGITHPCPYCEAVYDNRNKLKGHLFKHTGMPYICELCPGLGFDRRLRFANHMQKIHQKTLTEEELGKIFAKNTGKTVHFKKPESKT